MYLSKQVSKQGENGELGDLPTHSTPYGRSGHASNFQPPTSNLVGGQAVLEGVMMRCKNCLAIAVRTPDQEIILHKEKLNPVAQRWPIFKLPVLRGVAVFIEMLFVGTRALMYSANMAMGEEEELTSWQLMLTVVLGLGLGIGFFIVLPTVIMRFIGGASPNSPFFFNFLEGLIRLLILTTYVLAVSRIPDMRRVFQYHGAEHMAVHCFEAGEELVLEKARRFSPLHPRCGTAFLLIVVVLGIFIFSFFGWPGLVERILLRLSLLPLVAGLSYEVIKACGRQEKSWLRFLILPGLLMQRLTTRKPEDAQLEVALQALEAAVEGGDCN